MEGSLSASREPLGNDLTPYMRVICVTVNASGFSTVAVKIPRFLF